MREDLELHYGSEFDTGHYSIGLKPDVLIKWAERTAELIHDNLDGQRPIFVYSGMSGISHATALAIAYYQKYGSEFGMIYVRKPDEKSHGDAKEASLNNVAGEKVMLVFVDDTIDSGATRERVLQGAREHLGYRGGYEVNNSDFAQALIRSFEILSLEVV